MLAIYNNLVCFALLSSMRVRFMNYYYYLWVSRLWDQNPPLEFIMYTGEAHGRAAHHIYTYFNRGQN